MSHRFHTAADVAVTGGYEVRLWGETVELTRFELIAVTRHRNLRRQGLPAVLLYTTPEGETFEQEGLPLRRRRH